MFRVEEVSSNGHPIGLIVRFTNPFDAYYLLSRVLSCGCEFIAFTMYNIFTDFESAFPTDERMRTLRTSPTTTSEGVGHGGVGLGASKQAGGVLSYLGCHLLLSCWVEL